MNLNTTFNPKFKPNLSASVPRRQVEDECHKRQCLDDQQSSQPIVLDADAQRFDHTTSARKNMDFWFRSETELSHAFNVFDLREANEAQLQQAEQFAIQQGGRCLSGRCSSSNQPLLFECHMRHTWEMTLNSLHWCKKCDNLHSKA